MIDRTNIRLFSFALAALVTWGVFAGIDTLALEQTSGGLRMSQIPAATQTAAVTHAARS